MYKNEFNSQEILQKTKERYFTEKTAEYYLQNKELIKKKIKKLIQKFARKGKRQD